MNDRKWMDMREFHESGLLYQANREFFWPRGLALSVSVGVEPGPGEERPPDAGPAWGKPGEYEPWLRVIEMDPPDYIEDSDAALEAKAAAWTAARTAAIALNPINQK